MAEKTKRYSVVIPIAGTMSVEVDVPEDADEDAIYDAAVDAHHNRLDDCAVEWEFFQQIASGNVLHVSQNDWEYAEIKPRKGNPDA